MQPKRTIPRVCRQCGGDFLASVSAINAGKGLLCSVGCYGEWRKSHPTRQRHDVDVVCAHCGATFAVSPYRARQPRIFCSVPCQKAGRGQMPPHPIELSEDGLTAMVPLKTHSGDLRAYALIDPDDAEWAGQWRWHLDDDGYAMREERGGGRRQRILLHRALLGLTPDDDTIEGDHIDRNRLNDRRSNLRAIPKVGNRQNVPGIRSGSSTHRGVTWDRKRGKWLAQVMVNRKNHSLGLFDDETAAAEAARDARARLLPYAVD